MISRSIRAQPWRTVATAWFAFSALKVASAGLIGIMFVLGGNGPIRAQDYPDQPIKLVVPFIAGGPVDALARILAQDLSRRLGRTLIVENQAGGAGTIGTGFVAQASPDGRTLLFAINSLAYGLYAPRGYDLLKSFKAVATVAEWSHVLVVSPGTQAETIQELVAYAKANPGALTFGFGTNTPPQVLGETFKVATGADIRSIPYRGGAQAIADMLGGRIHMNFGTTATLLPLIQEGKLKAIAYTGAKRSPDLPNVPTVVEAGFPQLSFDPDAWAMILAPVNTPRPIIDRLNGLVNESLRTPDVLLLLAKLGYEPKIASPDAAAAFLAAEILKWPPIVKAAGLKPE